ncbi:MAG: hypothetical protein EOO98_07415 [Pedobacter sp.]|nr:MAG: hypothetical protein EOO98_07415 [Pedobacter sp.]
MARYKNGITGTFRGKVGNVVGVESRGIAYMRSLPEQSTKKSSEKQVKQQQKLAMLSCWLKPISQLIKVSVQHIGVGKTAMNEIFAINYREALTEVHGGWEINCQRAIFSIGELVNSIVTDFSRMQGKLNINWLNAPESPFNRDNHAATFVLHNGNKFLAFNAAALRADRHVELQLPFDFTLETFHCWMWYSDDTLKVSTTTYIGELV